MIEWQGVSVSDKPVEERQYTYGFNVVDIGDLRIARGETRRPRSSCKHLSLVFDEKERRVWCKDCEQEIEPFDAFKGLAEFFHAANAKLRDREEAVKEAEQFQLRSRAAKAVDKIWRTRTMVPCCPSCDKGLLPEDFANGVKSRVGVSFARKQRDRGDV